MATASAVQHPRTKKLNKFRRRVGLDPRRTATNRIRPGIDVVLRAKPIDIDGRFGLPRTRNHWIPEVAGGERECGGPKLFNEAGHGRSVTSLRHHSDPGFEVRYAPKQVHVSIDEDVVFESGCAHGGNE